MGAAYRSSREGFALAASILFLALLSVLGAAAIQSTTLETKISAHDRDARLALYLAEAALEEARYYAARGWGKIAPPASWAPGTPYWVEVTTPLPDDGSLVPTAADAYRHFLLADRTGQTFNVLHSAGPSGASPSMRLELQVSPGGPFPEAGRFTLLGRIAVGGFGPTVNRRGQWEPSGASPGTLRVLDADDTWYNVCAASGLDWTGWTLWDNGGEVWAVSATSCAPSYVDLQLTPIAGPAGAPPTLPAQLVRNPWLTWLAAATAAAPGDDDASTADVWDRVYREGAGETARVIGRALVSATPGSAAAGAPPPGGWRLTATGEVASQAGVATRRTVRFTVVQAGRPAQRVTDWVVR
ncbi:MAG: hypothetical protein Kow0092_36070 [Deferrisomatales bacterium]